MFVMFYILAGIGVGEYLETKGAPPGEQIWNAITWPAFVVRKLLEYLDK